MVTILTTVLHISLFVHIGLIAFSAWKVWRGENSVDRLLGLDVAGTLTIAILLLVALIEQRPVYIDIAIALAALSFIGVIALSRYLVDEQMF